MRLGRGLTLEPLGLAESLANVRHTRFGGILMLHDYGRADKLKSLVVPRPTKK